MHVIHLEDLVSIKSLDELMEKYYEATGMASSITDPQGRTIASHHFHPVCDVIRSFPELEKLCIQSDAYAGFTASITKKPYIYQCHCGLIDCAVPIFVEDACIGIIMTGQVLLTDLSIDQIPKISNYLPNMTNNIDAINYTNQYKGEIPKFTLKEITAYTKLLEIIARLISEMGYKNLMQEKFKKQKIKLLEEKNETAEAKTNLAKLNLNLMENQLPIQFLFESFNSIYQQAIIEGANETADIIFSLSSLLRRKLYSKDSLISLEEELIYINNYINMKNLSRHFRVKIKEEINHQCGKKIIPLTLLQSLTEHLFFTKIDKLAISSIITISAKEKNSHLILGLRCNHVTLPAIDLTEVIRKNMLITFFSKAACLAINNLIRMLSTYYNNSYEVNIIKTDDNCGELIISLPINIE